MLKTPDDVKKGLEHCINGTSCRGCPYCEECAIASDCNPMHKDLQEYVQQLEEFADKKIVELFEKVEQLQAERDAAVEEVHGHCSSCKDYDKDPKEEPCASCSSGYGNMDNWQRRGVTKEASDAVSS